VWRPKRSENGGGSAGAVVNNVSAEQAIMARQNGGGAVPVVLPVDDRTPTALQTSIVSVAVADTRQQQPLSANERRRQRKQRQQQLQNEKIAMAEEVTVKPAIESLGPPVTWHVTHDFVVTEPTANLFNVPNCLTDPSSDSGRFVRSSLQVHPKLSKF